jgi:L-alanine-DL-glutamate epimerase-like enolase superfamily enzyme
MAACQGSERISAIEIFPFSLELSQDEYSSKLHRKSFTNICVRLETESGIIGWGETSGATTGAPPEVARAVMEKIAPLVLGSNIFAIEALRAKVKAELPPSNHDRIVNLGFAGFDIACWDLLGKCLGRPINTLLGGRVRESVNYFAYCLSTELEPLVREATAAADQGFTVLYFKAGLDNAFDLKAVAEVREAVGPEIAIRVDVNERWDPQRAFQMLEKLARYSLDWVEAPIDARNLTKMSELRRRTRVPIAGNEFMWSPAEVSTAISLQACDAVVTGPLWLGGLMPLYQVGAICAASGTGLCLHAPPSSGIAVAAELQVMSTLPSIVDGNQTYRGHIVKDVVTGLAELDRGNISVPDGPGIGVTVDEDILRTCATGPSTEWRAS